MGQNNANAFRDQFSKLELKKSSQTKFWHQYDAVTCADIPKTTRPGGFSNLGGGGSPGARAGVGGGLLASRVATMLGESKSSPTEGGGSPNRSTSATSSGSSSDGGPTTLSRMGSFSGALPQVKEGTLPAGSVCTVWQVNVTHNAYTAAISGPQRRPPAQPGGSPHWHPTRTVLEKLYLFTSNGFHHPNVMSIHACDIPQGETNTLWAISEGSYVLAINVLNQLSPTEILYGLSCVVQAFEYLHSKGYGHFNLSWDSIYIRTSSTRQPWVIFDPNFICGGKHQIRFDPDGTEESDRIEEENFYKQRGAEICTLLNDVTGLREAKQLPFVAPEVKNAQPGDYQTPNSHTYGDVFSFGVLIEQLISEGKISSLGKGSVGSLKYISDQLKSFSRNCQKKEANKRPTLHSFLQLDCMQRSVFVRAMEFFDNFSEINETQKSRMFWHLHLDLMKIPYEQLLTRLLPRLLSVPLWNDSAAEPFVEQLLIPIRKIPAETVPVGLGEMCFLEPGSELPPSLASLPRGTELSLANVPLVGLLMHQDYPQHMGRFLKHALAKKDKTQLTCVLMRHVDKYVANIDFAIVTGHVIPTLISNLNHSCTDVVFEALRGFTSVARSVFAAAERGADVGRAKDDLVRAYSKEIFNIAASDTNMQVRMMALKLILRTLKGNTTLLPRNKAILAVSCCLTAPTVVKVKPGIKRDPSYLNFSFVTALAIANKTLDLVCSPELIKILTPAEIVLMVMPALFQLSQSFPLDVASAQQFARDAVALRQSSASGEEDMEKTVERLVAADRMLRYKALQQTQLLTQYLAEKSETSGGLSVDVDGSSATGEGIEGEEPLEQQQQPSLENQPSAKTTRGNSSGWDEAMDRFFQQEEEARREGWVSFPDLNVPHWGAGEGGRWSDSKVRAADFPDPDNPTEFFYRHPKTIFRDVEKVPTFNTVNRTFDCDWNSSGVLSYSKAMMTNGVNVPSVGGPSSRPHPVSVKLPTAESRQPVPSTLALPKGVVSDQNESSHGAESSSRLPSTTTITPSDQSSTPVTGSTAASRPTSSMFDSPAGSETKRKPRKKRSAIQLREGEDMLGSSHNGVNDSFSEVSASAVAAVKPVDDATAPAEGEGSQVTVTDEPKTPVPTPKKSIPVVAPVGRRKPAAPSAQSTTTVAASSKTKRKQLTEEDIDL